MRIFLHRSALGLVSSEYQKLNGFILFDRLKVQVLHLGLHTPIHHGQIKDY